MALASIGFKGVVTLSDQGGNRAVLRWDLTGADYATAFGEMSGMITSLNAVTDAQIIHWSVNHVYEEDTTYYGSGEVENVASISARIDDAEVKYATIRIPAPVDGIFQAATGPLYNVVDPADADLVTYLSHWETGAEALLSDGESLLDVATAGNVTGKRIHRKSRKG